MKTFARVEQLYAAFAMLKPERQPKDFAFRQRTHSKRAGKQSSRKDYSGVGLETGRFQPAMRQEPV